MTIRPFDWPQLCLWVGNEVAFVSGRRTANDDAHSELTLKKLFDGKAEFARWRALKIEVTKHLISMTLPLWLFEPFIKIFGVALRNQAVFANDMWQRFDAENISQHHAHDDSLVVTARRHIS